MWQFMETVLDTILNQAKARIGSLMMMDTQSQTLKIVAARGFPGEIIDQIKRLSLPPGQGIAGHVYQTGKPYYLKDHKNDPLFIPQNLSLKLPFHFLSFPLEDDLGQVLGVLNIHFPTEKILNAKELDELRRLANELVSSEINQQQAPLN